MRFKNREDAGRQLAAHLTDYAGRSDVLVLALPRGGVPVAFEVASALAAPLDVFLVRKLGVPGHPELAMGAIAAGGVEILNEALIRDLGVLAALVRQTAVRERLELERRDRLFRGGRRPAIVRDRTVVLVDDGLATGSTMEAAIVALRQHAPGLIVVAVPVGARATRATGFGASPTASSACRPLNRSARSGCGTTNSNRQATTTSRACSRLQAGRRRRSLFGPGGHRIPSR